MQVFYIKMIVVTCTFYRHDWEQSMTTYIYRTIFDMYVYMRTIFDVSKRKLDKGLDDRFGQQVLTSSPTSNSCNSMYQKCLNAKYQHEISIC